MVDHLLNFEGNDSGEPFWFLVMPLYLGSLANALPLPDLSTTEQVMAQIIEGLRFMHTKQVLHRDVKPDNILVNSLRPVHIKIGDLGWAIDMQDKLALRKTCGTPGFAAPEIPEKLGVVSSQIQTTAIDVYSLGATFYCMMCIGIFAKEPREFPELVLHQPPANHAGLIQSMMLRDPKERSSLDQCSEIVREKLRDWKKGANLDGRRLLPVTAPEPLSKVSGPSTNVLHDQRQPRALKATDMEQRAIEGLQSHQSKGRAQMTRVCAKNVPRPNARHCRLRATATFTGPKVVQTPILEQQRVRAARGKDRANPPPPHETICGRLGTQQTNTQRDSRAVDSPNVRPLRANYALAGVQALTKPQATKSTTEQQHTQTHPSNKRIGLKSYKDGHPFLAQAIHQLPRGAINKTQNTNSHKLRQLRRHPARANMIHRFNAIIQRKDQLLRGLRNLCRGVGIAVEGLVDSVQGACGIPCEVYSLVFKDFQQANAALKFIAPETKALGLTKERRVILGMKSKSFRNLSPGEYQAERRGSYLKSVGKKVPAPNGARKITHKA